MGQQEYLIGDIAAITGLSRDTLRFYEKKGILNARKKANGYRYFTEDDLYLLVRILFSRKLNFGLDSIEELLSRPPLCPDYQETLRQQADEEMRAIRFHRQALNRLLSMKKIYEEMEGSLNKFRIKTFPDSRMLYTFDSPTEGLKQWFRLTQEYPGMDMVYIYNCYQYQSGFSLRPPGCGEAAGAEQVYEAELKYRHTSLVLYQDVMEAMEPEYDFSEWRDCSGSPCIHTTVEARDPEPEVSLISSMRTWAAGKGFLPASEVFVTSNVSGIRVTSPVYSQEIYIPLL